MTFFTAKPQRRWQGIGRTGWGGYAAVAVTCIVAAICCKSSVSLRWSAADLSGIGRFGYALSAAE